MRLNASRRLAASKVLDKALDMLQELLDKGVEFPDASAKVCQKFKCQSDDLRDAYDALYASVVATARDTNFVPQHLAKIFRPIGAKFVKQSGKNYFFRTESKVGKEAVVALLAKLPEATAAGDKVTINCQSPIGLVYEEVLRVIANDDPDSRMFNILLED